MKESNASSELTPLAAGRGSAHTRGFTLTWSPEAQTHCGLGCRPITQALPAFTFQAFMFVLASHLMVTPHGHLLPSGSQSDAKSERTGCGDGQAFKRHQGEAKRHPRLLPRGPRCHAPLSWCAAGTQQPRSADFSLLPLDIPLQLQISWGHLALPDVVRCALGGVSSWTGRSGLRLKDVTLPA